MSDELDIYQGKTTGELGREAVSFLVHTLIAVAIVLLILLGGTVLHANPDAVNPKVVATVLSFLLAMLAGFAIARARHDYVARYVWICGLVFFAVLWVWVIDLPTGPGLCEHCVSLAERTRRTFFSIQEGSGLAGGWGLVLGCWVPLALIGYALGARFGLGSAPEPIEN